MSPTTLKMLYNMEDCTIEDVLIPVDVKGNEMRHVYAECLNLTSKRSAGRELVAWVFLFSSLLFNKTCIGHSFSKHLSGTFFLFFSPKEA